MTIVKLPSAKFRAVLKVGRVYAASRSFATKRDGQAWLARERATLARGVDPRADRAGLDRLNALGYTGGPRTEVGHQ